MRFRSLILGFALWCAATPAWAVDFNLGLSYAQSQDFWRLVQDVQDKRGDIGAINRTLYDKYGKPDLLFSYAHAEYAYQHDYFSGGLLGQAVIGTQIEALAGGEVSNPISPEIQAYLNRAGITSFGFRSRADSDRETFFELKGLAGIGTEKRLYAQGAELIDAIPVRTGTLFLAGIQANLLNHTLLEGDFSIATDAMLRPVFFHSTVPVAMSRPNEDRSFAAWRWRLQNEWLKETNTWLGNRTRFGIVSVLGQDPYPFFALPITWDYQQKLKAFPGLGSVSGVGGIMRILSENSLPNFAFYAGLFGGAVGGGVDFQLGPVLLNGSTYAVQNFLTPNRERTRLWHASIGVAL